MNFVFMMLFFGASIYLQVVGKYHEGLLCLIIGLQLKAASQLERRK
jgi:hypothetical protein